MERKTFLEKIAENKVIASVKENKHLEKPLQTNNIVFLLTGNIGVIKSYVDLYKKMINLFFCMLKRLPD